MAGSLSPDSVLRPTPWCVVREQEDRYLVYSSRSDELHLLTPTGFHVYGLFDGVSTVAEVEARLSAALAMEPDALRGPLRGFLARLVERGILETDDDA